MTLIEMGKNAKLAAGQLMTVSTLLKNSALEAIADALGKCKDIKVSISQMAVYSESEYYVNFSIWIDTTAYYFVNESDKTITEGGHY